MSQQYSGTLPLCLPPILPLLRTTLHPTVHTRNRRCPNSSFPHTPCPVSQQILPARWNPRPHPRPCSCPGPHHLSLTSLILTASKLVFLLPLFPHPGLFPHSSERDFCKTKNRSQHSFPQNHSRAIHLIKNKVQLQTQLCYSLAPAHFLALTIHPFLSVTSLCQPGLPAAPQTGQIHESLRVFAWVLPSE